jgi:hypothetical protein
MALLDILHLSQPELGYHMITSLLELTSKLASVREKELRIIMYLTSKFYSTLISLAE